MQPKRAFNVDKNAQFKDCGISTVPIEAMAGLIELLRTMDPENPNAPSGGEHILVQDNGTIYRLTFCDFTRLVVCPFCSGTGAKPKDNTN